MADVRCETTNQHRNCKHKEIIKGANEEGNEGRQVGQITRWVGSRQIDMRAHGTQKTKTKAMCSHKTKTQTHGQEKNHQPCAKQDMNTQLFEKTHQPRIHTRHDNMKARKHVDRRERAAERTRDRTLPQRDRTWSASVRRPTRNRNSRHECRDPNTTLQHETRHADERAHTLEHSSTLEAAR